MGDAADHEGILVAIGNDVPAVQGRVARAGDEQVLRMGVGDGFNGEMLVVAASREGPIGQESHPGIELVFPLLQAEGPTAVAAEVLEHRTVAPCAVPWT